jgi:hypothetical protein
MGTDIDAVPVAGFAVNFSPIPRIAPPDFGRDRPGAAIVGGVGANADVPSTPPLPDEAASIDPVPADTAQAS